MDASLWAHWNFGILEIKRYISYVKPILKIRFKTVNDEVFILMKVYLWSQIKGRKKNSWIIYPPHTTSSSELESTTYYNNQSKKGGNWNGNGYM